ncbi:MAG: arsenate reductase ArsC [Methylophaga nitratireducenticrescens]|nr:MULTISPECIES: arsenate reductase ArsC [Methylophaga]THF70015.1 MAG: arsenate reductase ArsC [Methylophaga nitratireducenticrescens]THK40509.1 arsenate reductase ArsC [Methylophaga sp. SB9B]
MFLCTGNSCRSQMAEGWARFLTGDDIEIRSAGIEAHGQNAQAIKVMAEVGIDISQQESIRVNGEMLEWADLLVILCENADEQCPIVSPHTLRLHLPLTDPAKYRGTEEEILAEFRLTREKIKQRVNYVLQQLNKSVVNGR